jgi:hypothetical protein
MTRLRILVALFVLAALATPAFAGKKLEGRWALNVTIPVSAVDGTKRTFAINLDVGPRGDSLHGRMTITDDSGHTVGGVYRQKGKKVSITYELPCDGSDPATCGSIILKGKIKNSNTTLKGSVVVMWDTANPQNPALYDTSNGSFSGTRLP